MVMRASNNAYIRLTEHSLRNKKAICYPNVYELDENGLNYLRDFGETIPKRHSVFNMPHELLADHIIGSIRIWRPPITRPSAHAVGRIAPVGADVF